MKSWCLVSYCYPKLAKSINTLVENYCFGQFCSEGVISAGRKCEISVKCWVFTVGPKSLIFSVCSLIKSARYGTGCSAAVGFESFPFSSAFRTLNACRFPLKCGFQN